MSGSLTYLVIANDEAVFPHLSINDELDHQRLMNTPGDTVEVLARIVQTPDEVELALSKRVDAVVDLYATQRKVHPVRLYADNVYKAAGVL